AVESDQIETRQAERVTRPGERLKGAFADGRNAIAKIIDIEEMVTRALVQEARPRRAVGGAAALERETAREPGGEGRRMLVSFDVAEQEDALALDVLQSVIEPP